MERNPKVIEPVIIIKCLVLGIFSNTKPTALGTLLIIFKLRYKRLTTRYIFKGMTRSCHNVNSG